MSKKQAKKKKPTPATVPDVPKNPHETPARTIHRYHQILKSLDIDYKELDGSTPMETQEVMDGVLREFKERRTEEQVVLQKGVKVTLGKKVYELPPLTLENSIKFRERCGVFGQNLFNFVVENGRVVGKDPDAPINKEIPMLTMLTKKSGLDMHALYDAAMPYVAGEGFDELIEILFLCSEELEKDREKIIKEASLVQLSNASLEVFRTALPFVVNIFRGMWITYGSAGGSALRGI